MQAEHEAAEEELPWEPNLHRAPPRSRHAGRVQVWRQLLRNSRHELIWTGQSFACRQCKIARGPTKMREWFRQGACPGPSATSAHRTKLVQRQRHFPPGTVGHKVVEILCGILEEPKDEEQDDSPTKMEDAEERPAKHAQGLGIHPSHRISVRSIWAWCRNCGSASRGERYKGLKQPCHRPTTAGKHTLARIKQGKAPHKGCEWGDEA